MESLALLVMGIFIGILVLSGLAVTLAVLSWAGKISKVWGYVVTGLLLAVTIWAYSVSVPLGMWPTIPLIVAAIFSFTSKKPKR
ncbi:MAG: hypothetical protein RL488_188 [Actinomycetota bacterium]|jgi:hypothetical protein